MKFRGRCKYPNSDGGWQQPHYYDTLIAAYYPPNVYAAGVKRAEHAPNTPLVPRTLLQALFLGSALVVAVGSG